MKSLKAISAGLVALSLLSVPVSFPALSFAAFDSSASGTATAGFLKLGAGARAASMGEACTAVADDATALYWNPASLTRLTGKSLSLMHAIHLESSFYDYAAYGQRLGEHGALGIGLQYFSAGSLNETDTTGTELGSFTPSDLALTVGYGHELQGLGDGGRGLGFLNGSSIGIGVKFIQSKIVDTAQTMAVDLGVLSRPLAKDKLRLAFTASNIGGKMKFDSASEDLPLTLKAGAAYQFTPDWLASLDFGFPKDEKPYTALGAEYSRPLGGDIRIAARAGYSTRPGDIGGLAGLSFGLGLAYGSVGFDYGLLAFGDLGLAHRLSLSYRFAASPKAS